MQEKKKSKPLEPDEIEEHGRVNCLLSDGPLAVGQKKVIQ
jgi:hypothetical protein